MTDGVPRRRAGEGPLTYGLIVRDAAGMLRTHFLRVAVAALALFIAPAALIAGVGSVSEQVGRGTPHPLVALAATLAAVVRRRGP